MGETKKLFQELIGAFDTFITKEEKEIGCLTEEEHTEIIKMRNRIDDIFMQKINSNKAKTVCNNQKETLIVVPYLNDDDTVEAYKKKRQQEMER